MPASSIGAVTVVLRTTSTSAPLFRIASTNVSSFRSGSYSTSQPAALRPLIPLCSNLSATSTFILLCALCELCGSYHVDEQPISELRFKPRRLRRHDRSGVGDRHQIGDPDRMERKGGCGAALIDELLELPGAAGAADEIDALVGADVGDDEDWSEQLILQDADVER